MVSTRADDTDADTVTLIPASEAIDNVNAVSGVEVVDSTLAVDTPNLKFSVSMPALNMTSHA
jgi:hypothetical protein